MRIWDLIFSSPLFETCYQSTWFSRLTKIFPNSSLLSASNQHLNGVFCVPVPRRTADWWETVKSAILVLLLYKLYIQQSDVEINQNDRLYKHMAGLSDSH